MTTTTTKTPRLLEAAKEFNIGRETLVAFLIDKGFEIANSPSAKLTEKMYNALQVEFAQDKLAKRRSDEIALPKGSLLDSIRKTKDDLDITAKDKKEEKPKEAEKPKEKTVEVKEEPKKPVVQQVVDHLGSMGALNYHFIALAIPEPGKLSPENQERVRDALLKHMDFLMKTGKISELFSCLEIAFPLYFDSFKILDEHLPKICRSKYIGKMPSYLAGNREDYRQYLEKQGFSGDELEELLEELCSRKSNMLMYLQEMRKPRALRFKKTGKLIEGEK